MSFDPFTMVHEEKKQWVRFEPTDDPEKIHVRFRGACGHVMENTVSKEIMTATLADLYAKGYEETKDF